MLRNIYNGFMKTSIPIYQVGFNIWVSCRRGPMISDFDKTLGVK